MVEHGFIKTIDGCIITSYVTAFDFEKCFKTEIDSKSITLIQNKV